MKKVVFTNGVFDILHKGHLDLLRFCKEQGDYLVVAIDSDNRVRQTKGDERPINTQWDRKALLEAIRFVDKVVVFDSLSELRVLHETVKPDIVVKGSDWRSGDIRKTDGILQESQLVFFPLLDGRSTTSVIERIRRTKCS